MHFGNKVIRKMRLSPIHHLPPTASGARERIQSYQEADLTGLGSLPLLSPPKRALWRDWYWITDHPATAESLFDLREILIYKVLKDQIFLQHPDVKGAKK